MEVNELFSGWKEFPPTNFLVKAIVEGFGGGSSQEPKGELEIPPEAMETMQNSAMQAIASKAGHRLPVISGPDKGLPEAKPLFDVEEMRKRNAEVVERRKSMRQSNV